MIKHTKSNIVFLTHKLIDKVKWDACVLSSSQPLIYATSVYLDGMCLHWDALVLNDYEAVMPLPWNRKWCLSYVYSPYFVIAGGVFGKSVSENVCIQFLKAIPTRFSLIDLNLSEPHFFSDAFTQNSILFEQRRNTILSLQNSYQHIYSNYSSAAKRKLKKAEKQCFEVNKTLQIANVIALYKRLYKKEDSAVSRFDFTIMIALLEGKLQKQTKTYVLSFPNGEICAFYLLLFDDNYVYWLLGGSTPKGKEVAAFYYLTNIVIQDFANTSRLFRFEGSDHEGIHFFNSQFGGKTVFYPRLTINRLPWPLRYLK